MRSPICASVMAAVLVAATQPALAADFAESRTVQTGAFAGLRLRIPLGADPARAGLQAGMTVAPAVLSTTMGGHSRRIIGEGVELSFRQREPMTLRLAGTRMDRLGMAPTTTHAPGGRRAGVSTLGWIAIGVGTIVLAVGVGTAILAHEISENDD